MKDNLKFGNASIALPHLCHALLKHGNVHSSRAGDTHELTHIGITLGRPWQRELIVPGRKHSIAAQIAETMWVLAGRNDIGWLTRYLPRAPQFSDDGVTWRGAYGARLRHWKGEIDQLEHVINLLLEHPNTRQAVATIYDPQIDTKPGADIPCNNWLDFTIRDGKLDLQVAIRSNDLIWGWSGINAFEWSALQEIVAFLVGVEVGELHFSIGSLHLYGQHFERAEQTSAARSQTEIQYADSPRFEMPPERVSTINDLQHLDELIVHWFVIEELIYQGQNVSAQVEAFPEPMLRSWLRVIQWWWTGDPDFLNPLANTRLYASASLSVQPKVPAPDPDASFLEYVNKLHADKHQAYGNSWKKRGEMLGIMANIARKIDRLGTNSADETSTDTAIDLMVYLAKYRWWLSDTYGAEPPTEDVFYQLVRPLSDYVQPVEKLLGDLAKQFVPVPVDLLERQLNSDFDQLERNVVNNRSTQVHERTEIVDLMLQRSFNLAYQLWKP